MTIHQVANVWIEGQESGSIQQKGYFHKEKEIQQNRATHLRKQLNAKVDIGLWCKLINEEEAQWWILYKLYQKLICQKRSKCLVLHGFRCEEKYNHGYIYKSKKFQVMLMTECPEVRESAGWLIMVEKNIILKFSLRTRWNFGRVLLG